MSETIDLIALRSAQRGLAAFTKETGQPTDIERLDLEPLRTIKTIEITEEFITVSYNESVTHRYNVKELAYKEWEYKYNDDPEFVRAIRRVIDLSRKHLLDLPENLACPPGCAECCSGYEPFVNTEDVARLATHFGLTIEETLQRYVVERDTADGYVLGYLRKVTEDVADRCVFLQGTASGKYYCGVYEARPSDCRAFTPIGCSDVDTDLPRDRPWPTGPAFQPRRKK